MLIRFSSISMHMVHSCTCIQNSLSNLYSWLIVSAGSHRSYSGLMSIKSEIVKFSSSDLTPTNNRNLGLSLSVIKYTAMNQEVMSDSDLSLKKNRQFVAKTFQSCFLHLTLFLNIKQTGILVFFFYLLTKCDTRLSHYFYQWLKINV